MGGDEKEEDVAAAARQPLRQPPEALETIFRQHHEAVFRAAYRITGDAMDAEDVLQTVFVRLLRRDEKREPLDPGLDPEGGLSRYLHRAAVNAALDLLRGRKRRPAVGLDEVADDLADTADIGPDRRRHSQELRTRLREALSRLTPRAAEIFAMRYFEGFGNLEIARLTGASQTAVAVLLHRARHRLQKELAPLQGDLS